MNKKLQNITQISFKTRQFAGDFIFLVCNMRHAFYKKFNSSAY